MATEKKEYLTLDEAKQMLRCDDTDIRAMVREGRLREFRHGGQVMFKSFEVEKLAEERAGREAETTDVLDLVLEPAEEPTEGSGSGVPLSPGEGLAGSSLLGLADEEPPSDEESKKDDTVITSVGVNVLEEEGTVASADPMAKTVLSEEESALGLEGTGSGSGLLDLTRESDDTSLGAELLEEIYPEGDQSRAGVTASRIGLEAPPEKPPEEDTGTAVALEGFEEVPAGAEEAAAAAPAAVAVAAPAPRVALPGAFTAMVVLSCAMLLVAGFAATAVLRGVWPAFLDLLARHLLPVGGGALGLTIVLLIAGLLSSGGLALPKGGKRTGKGKKEETAAAASTS